MPRPKSGPASHVRKPARQSVSLRSLAEHLGLSQAAVSLVINRSPAAKSIPQRTQDLIRQAARELNYRPNQLARSLRQQRSYTIGVVVPEISEGYAALVMSGIEDHLLEEGYFYFVVSHRHRSELIEEYPLLLQQRAVEGLIAVDTAFTEVVQLEGESSSPELGYQVTKKLLASGELFTGLFAFNDISAIGAVQALREAGRRVPQDVSVVGFDDIQSAAFQNPALTTVRQPLREMGVIAAETLLQRITAPLHAPYPKEIIVEPSLVVRASTTTAPGSSRDA